MQKYDLHIHSNESDGKYSKTDLIYLAEIRNIQLISFCDHNSCKNFDINTLQNEYLKKYGKNFSTKILVGTEISASSKICNGVHILGYGMNNIKLLQGEFEKINLKNSDKVAEQVRLINENFDIPITINEVEKCSDNRIITSKDLANAMLKYGYIKNMSDMHIFTEYSSKSHINKYKMEDIDAINMIHKAGGVAILAHPIKLRNIKNSGYLNKNEFEEYLEYLINHNIDGIESHSLKHTDKQKEEFYKIAKEKKLLVTAGSDFHDEKRTPYLGVEYNPEIFLFPLLNSIKEKHKNINYER